jgi:hypothetical protein
VVLPHYPYSCGELRFLVSWCVGDRCDLVGSDEDHGSSGRPGAEDHRWLSIGRVFDSRVIGRSSDVVCDPCTCRRGARVSWLSLKTKVVGFPGLGLKTDSSGLMICDSKSQ